MYKLHRDRRKEKRQLRTKRIVKLVIFIIVAIGAWQAWTQVAAIWPWEPGPQPDPYKDCIAIDGPARKNIAEVCPDN